MIRKIFHHAAEECSRVCCTKIENFGVKIGDLTIFENVNLHVHCGELTAIVGPNGAGKSTLLKAILNEVPHTGHLSFTDAKNRRTGKPLFGYVPQHLDFDKNSPLSVTDLFAASLSKFPAWLGHSAKLKKIVAQDLSRVKAEHLANRRLGALSGGELQRVLLALALRPLPDLLLLDEPVSGVDSGGLAIFYDMVSKLRESEDLAVVLISHDIKTVRRYADKVVLMKDKRAECGTPDELLTEEKTDELFGLQGNTA